MPQVDLEARGDDRASGETLIGGEGTTMKFPEAEDPDLPAESYRIRIEDEIGWVNINAVYDRDVSTKGSTNPKSQHANQKPTASSQRWSGNLKAKAPIIGLPIQHSGYLDHSARRPANGSIFPKGGGRKPAAAPEPRSPKVSCMGSVLSERDRDRSRRRRRESPEEEKWDEFWASLAVFFRCGDWCDCGQRAAAVGCVGEESSAPSGNIPTPSGKLPPSLAAKPAMEAPGLGGMNRFVSGRRSASWGGDADVEAEDGRHVAWSEPLGREGRLGR